MRLTKKLVLFLLASSLIGCSEIPDPAPREVSSATAVTIADSMTYVKSKSGMCFGVNTIRFIDEYHIVNVSCDELEKTGTHFVVSPDYNPAKNN